MHPITNKGPWATIDGEDVGDSQLIIEKLAKLMDKDLTKHMDPKQVAPENSMRIMMEEHFYWALVMDR